VKADSKTSSTRINEEINASQVRLIGVDGSQLGVVAVKHAMKLADEAGVDLVEIAPQAKPPVCRIMDFGKYRYEMGRKEKDARKKQHQVQIKGIRLTPNIDDHDFSFKLEAAKKFIAEGSKVKVMVVLKGRLVSNKEFAMSVLNRFAEGLAEISKVESAAKMEGARNMVMIFQKK
jgi:translation initiation factor IF-3